jgi:hypothetical protein
MGGGRLPLAESNGGKGSAAAKVAPPEPPQVLRTSVSLSPDQRLGGLNNIVAKIIDPQKKTTIAQIPPEWQIDLSTKLRELSAKIFGGPSIAV